MKAVIKSVFKEPLLHFLVLGLILFFVNHLINGSTANDDPSVIIVDRGKLLTYLQYRSRAFDEVHSEEILDKLSSKELQKITDDYVREEALYREAKAMQLDRNDRVARLRLIQQLEFILQGFNESGVTVSEDDIQDYYEKHKIDYYKQPRITFTHIFFSQERHGTEKAKVLAYEKLMELNQNSINLEQAPAHGDRFLYNLNYIERKPEEIASHFGKAMQEMLFALEEPDSNEWYGPFQSVYGFHLVLIMHVEVGYQPSLHEVKEKIKQDVYKNVLETRLQESIISIINSYTVRMSGHIQEE